MPIPFKKINFKDELNGLKTSLYTIKNNNGIRAHFTNYGQRLVALYLPDKNGELVDVVLGFDTLKAYLNCEEAYFGAVIGRYANRIANACFSLDGKVYRLNANNGPNSLHGGPKGFHNVVWKAEQTSTATVYFTRTSPDMEEGFPGNLKVNVGYTLTDKNELRISYQATTDKKTVVNLTHHSYFNLGGEGQGNINNHLLTINADTYTPVDQLLIPTGEVKKVLDTPFDFRNLKPIGEHINEDDPQIGLCGGYDHNFMLTKNNENPSIPSFAAKVIEPIGGRVMEVYTNQPGIQLYTSNSLDGSILGKSRKPYQKNGAFCLETQHLPDSPNQLQFPSTVLEPNNTYEATCIYKFSVV
ncbi:Aldose 1-epimerase [Croceitalea dokdonensis DOKDO 023]|uniref:Aldose 1-epimerase n=1 Tax=Croceitalea dokdonensis DOKDO 023 TaxID=1300341 RepID=A0A0N8H3T9_9FLAO|nr:aldose epimerase family protein [Croceitalea dokdonensis]KPM31500.1 Aldose 1-epimerase [Croceitalea dokdonensis DOKDO 023]